MGYVLLFIASLLKWIFGPFLYICNNIIALYKGEWNEYNTNLAIAKDQYGNALGKYLFNFILIKNNGYKFGNIDETISSVIGKNKIGNTLNLLGRFLDKILNLLEKNHSIKSIDNTINQ